MPKATYSCLRLNFNKTKGFCLDFEQFIDKKTLAAVTSDNFYLINYSESMCSDQSHQCPSFDAMHIQSRGGGDAAEWNSRRQVMTSSIRVYVCMYVLMHLCMYVCMLMRFDLVL